jgi:hypothetical protein
LSKQAGHADGAFEDELVSREPVVSDFDILVVDAEGVDRFLWDVDGDDFGDDFGVDPGDGFGVALGDDLGELPPDAAGLVWVECAGDRAISWAMVS